MRYLSDKEIRFAFQYLKDSLPVKPTAVSGIYSLPKELDLAFNGSKHQREVALQRISDHMERFLGLPNSVRVSFVDKKEGGEKTHTVFIADNEGNVGANTTSEFIEEEKSPGLYRVRDYDHGEIIIVNDRTFYLVNFLSVLANYLTQHYLYHHHITTPEEIDSKEFTDLAAIYLGFGSVILRGYVPSAAISCRLGYIDVPTIRRSIL